jgi:hypothetical protein
MHDLRLYSQEILPSFVASLESNLDLVVLPVRRWVWGVRRRPRPSVNFEMDAVRLREVAGICEPYLQRVVLWHRRRYGGLEAQLHRRCEGRVIPPREALIWSRGSSRFVRRVGRGVTGFGCSTGTIIGEKGGFRKDRTQDKQCDNFLLNPLIYLTHNLVLEWGFRLEIEDRSIARVEDHRMTKQDR